MLRINQVKLAVSKAVEHEEAALESKLRSILHIRQNERIMFEILKKSIDAREKPQLYFVYSVAVSLSSVLEAQIMKKNRNANIQKYEKQEYQLRNPGDIQMKHAPIVVGAGPAGLFCAYLLAQKGYCPIILERGENVDKRVKTVDKFWRDNSLSKESNVQFGEGGAGTFSDGKLNTLVKDPEGRNQYVLNTFVKFGADKKCAFVAKPHVGTDVLRDVVRAMRKEIINLGGQFVFECKMTDLVIEKNTVKAVVVDNYGEEKSVINGTALQAGRNVLNAEQVVLAIGHSARDTFERLFELGIPMEQKDFAVGLRMEHRQDWINECQYGIKSVEGLGAADYKVTNKASNGRNVYSFCMCPGGYVVNASSEEGRLAVNGMSYADRASSNANAAIIVSVKKDDFISDHPLEGMYFQRRLEEKAYELGKGSIPIQRFDDFKEGKVTKAFGEVTPCTRGMTEFADLRELLPEEFNEAMIESIEKFGYTMKGFSNEDALLSGVESRTSSPLRILRDESGQSNVKGLYPCGEGAGYAGGITSAAMDGMKIAEKIIEKYYYKR